MHRLNETIALNEWTGAFDKGLTDAMSHINELQRRTSTVESIVEVQNSSWVDMSANIRDLTNQTEEGFKQFSREIQGIQPQKRITPTYHKIQFFFFQQRLT